MYFNAKMRHPSTWVSCLIMGLCVIVIGSLIVAWRATPPAPSTIWLGDTKVYHYLKEDDLIFTSQHPQNRPIKDFDFYFIAQQETFIEVNDRVTTIRYVTFHILKIAIAICCTGVICCAWVFVNVRKKARHIRAKGFSLTTPP